MCFFLWWFNGWNKFRNKSKSNDKNNNNLEVRRLGAYSSISADQTFNVGKYNVLGQTVTVKYHVAVSKGNQINEIIIDSNWGKTTIGNTGVSLKGS